MSIARALLAKQQQLGITTKAKLARKIGVSTSTLYNVLAGSHGGDSRTLMKYARFLNWPLAKVLKQVPRQRHARRPPGGRPASRR